MAQAALKDISKTELAEAYGKLKLRDKKRRQSAKAETEALIEDLVTVGSGIGMGWLMGMRTADADLTNLKQGETIEDRIKEKTQVAGIDLDLLISLGAAGVGLTKYGGTMSGFMRSVGIGGLTSWGSRKFFFKAIEDKDDELAKTAGTANPPGAFPSGAYGYFS